MDDGSQVASERADVSHAAKARDERRSKRDNAEHEKHRMRGHFPYDPN